MLKLNINTGFPRSPMLVRLVVLILIVIAFYPIFDSALDAYSDHLTHPLRMSPDERIHSDDRNHHTPKIIVFQRSGIPPISEFVFHLSRLRATPALEIKTSEGSLPQSSDLSPPVA